MLSVWLNRFWFWLFGKKKNALLIARDRDVVFDYSTLSTFVYTTLKRAINRIIRNKPCFLLIVSKFNGKHYPVIDVDDQSKMTEALRLINSHNIGYAVIQSSPYHHWIILDFGHKNFYKANRILIALGKLGDQRYYDMNFNRKHYLIRAFYYSDVPNHVPVILSNDQLILLDQTFSHNISKSTETGAWRASYYRNRMIAAHMIPYSANFSEYIQELQKYYTTQCQSFSQFKFKNHERN